MLGKLKSLQTRFNKLLLDALYIFIDAFAFSQAFRAEHFVDSEAAARAQNT